MNNSGDFSWNKDTIFISEVFRFEDLSCELVTEHNIMATLFYEDPKERGQTG